MMQLFFVMFALIISLTACSSLHTTLPLTDQPPATAQTSSVFVGNGRASRFVDGSWIRLPEQDYELILLERRFADRWEVIKELHRRHPRYDGSAGPRDQTLYFLVRTKPAGDRGLDLIIEGTLGSGTGHETADGGVLLELAPTAKGWFVPFDMIRISQTRTGTQAGFEEFVELFSVREGHEIPFMRIQEEGSIYRATVPKQ